MKRKKLIGLLLFCFFNMVFSSTYMEREKIEEVKKSGNYYYGEGADLNTNEAAEGALNEMVNQIAVRVSSNFNKKISDKNGDVDRSVKHILKTQSMATLRNFERISYMNNEDEIVVFYYIKKDEVNKIFEERKKLINELYQEALKMEENQNIGGALKYGYFAMILLNSLTEERVQFGKINLSIEIPMFLDKMLKDIKFKVIKRLRVNEKEEKLFLEVNYKNKPAANLDFEFWDGYRKINCTANSGEAIATLVGQNKNIKELKIWIKYNYYESRDENKAVSELWDYVVKKEYKNESTRQITIPKEYFVEKEIEKNNLKLAENKNILPKEIMEEKSSVKEKEEKEITDIKRNMMLKTENDKCEVLSKIIVSLDKLISGIENGDIEYLKKDEFVYNKIRNLKKYNKFKIAERDINGKLNRTVEGWEVRSLKVNNYYDTIDKESIERVVVDFDNNGNITDLNFAVFENLYEKFEESGEKIGDWNRKQIIIKFVEKYRTAFMSRDLKTIDTIFSDKAVIIIGRITEEEVTAKNYEFIGNENKKAIYEKHNKSAYIKNLRNLFESKKDIFLGYSSFNIYKKQDDNDVYGISMRQNYLSTNYADEGHLFLLVDFKEKIPKIYVRSWQPQEWSREQIFTLSDFKVLK